MLEKIENAIKNHELSQMTSEDRQKYLADAISVKAYNSLVAQDMLQTITIYEDFHEDATKALGQLALPEGYEDPNGESVEESTQKLIELIKANVSFSIVTDEQLSQIEVDQAEYIDGNELIFSMQTRMENANIQLDQFLLRTGIVAKLSQAGLCFTPTYSEKRVLALFASLFVSEAQNEDQILLSTQ